MHSTEWFDHRQAVLGTKHGKEHILGPLFREAFDMHIRVPEQFDTDQFGTFTRDVPRLGDQRATLRAKALAAMERIECDIGLASEGSFCSHPDAPFVPVNTELVMLIDRRHGLEIVGGHVATNVSVQQVTVRSVEEAVAFAHTHRFPEFGLIVRRSLTSARDVLKDLDSLDAFTSAVQSLLRKSWRKTICIETDLRAHRHPVRRQNIATAARDLIAKMQSYCPKCGVPGFDYVEIKRGLPCRLCLEPTDQPLSHLYRCAKCAHELEKRFPYDQQFADPAQCQYCNP